MILAEGVTQIAEFSAASAAIAGAIVGIIFRSAALAWRDEAEAATKKADRLEKRVEELEGKLHHLERLTDVSALADQQARANREIVHELKELVKTTHANTVVLELICKQIFPAAVIAAPEPQ